MRDEEYRAEQIGSYGAGDQPAVAARMTPHLRLTRVGAGAGVLAVAAAVAAIVRFPRFTTESTGVGWAVLALVCAVVMTGICVVQLAGLAGGDGLVERASQHPADPVGAALLLGPRRLLPRGPGCALRRPVGQCGPGLDGERGDPADPLAAARAARPGAGGGPVRASERAPRTVPTHMRRLLARERARQAAAAAIVERDGPGPR